MKKDSGYSVLDSAKDTVIKTEPRTSDLSKQLETSNILNVPKNCDSQTVVKMESSSSAVEQQDVVKTEPADIEIIDEGSDSDREGTLTPGPEPIKCNVELRKSNTAM